MEHIYHFYINTRINVCKKFLSIIFNIMLIALWQSQITHKVYRVQSIFFLFDKKQLKINALLWQIHSLPNKHKNSHSLTISWFLANTGEPRAENTNLWSSSYSSRSNNRSQAWRNNSNSSFMLISSLKLQIDWINTNHLLWKKRKKIGIVIFPKTF